MAEHLEEHVRQFIDAAAATDPFPVGGRFGTEETSAYLARMRARVRPPREVAPVDAVSDMVTPGGVPVRVYVPSSDDRDRVLVVYLHGGGWVSGDLDMHDPTCRTIANGADVAVVNVDYRLAPENPYPVPLDDAFEAVEWAVRHARQWGCDPDRVVLAGTSAGANLAASVAVRWRDEGRTPLLLGQVLIYPVLDARMDTDSYREKGTGYFLTADQMRFFWDAYIQDPEVDRRSALLSPGLVEKVHGLPPALVITAEHDPLRDEGDMFARRLEDAGLLLGHERVRGQIHGFLTAFPGSKASRDTMDRIVDVLRGLRASSPVRS